MSTDHERETLKKVVDLLSQLKTLLKHNYIQFFHISLPSFLSFQLQLPFLSHKLQLYVHEISIRLIIPDIYH